MAGEIIRQGDPTSHHGTVLEGSMTDICMGKPIAYIGHKVHCPKCRGDFPIIEGVQTTTFYGKGVALAGMKTSCGAVLIATQFTDTVDWGGGSSVASPTDQDVNNLTAATPSAVSEPSAPAQDISHKAAIGHGDGMAKFDEQFLLKDEDGKAIADMPFTVKLLSGELIRGVTDGEGKTGRYNTDDAQMIEIYLGHH